MLQLFIALTLVVLMMLAYVACVRLVLDPSGPLWRTVRRLRERSQARRATADLDREYASLVDEHRRIP